MPHTFDRPTYDARKAAQADAKAKDAANPASIPELRDLVRAILDALGLR